MISESQAKLLPSEELKRELRAILKAKPELYELTRRQPDDPDPGRKVTLFAFDDGKRQAYPLIEIMGKWQGKVFVGRVPGDSKDNSLAFELDAIKQFGISHVVCLIPEEDIEDVYGISGYVQAARERFGERFIIVEILNWEPPVDDEAYEKALDQIHAALCRGESVLVHCGAACGRTGTFVSCLLVKQGMDTTNAVKKYRKFRGCGPETEDQAAYVARYENRCK